MHLHGAEEPITISSAEVGSALSVTYCSALKTKQNTLIPLSEEIERFEVDGDLSWVLVIEKEASSLSRDLRMIDFTAI